MNAIGYTSRVSRPARQAGSVWLVGVRWPRLWLWFAVLVASTASSQAQSGIVLRSGPAFYRAGTTLTLTNATAPTADTFLQTIDQGVPPGWTVGAISDEGRHVPEAGRVSWGPFFDGLSRKLTVALTPPAGTTGRVTLAGSASFDGVAVVPGGLGSLGPAPAPGGRITRYLPSTYLPGKVLTLTNIASLEPGVETYAVEELLPEGWSLVSANESGALLPDSNRLRWGPFFDGVPRIFLATVRAPGDAADTVRFDGFGHFGPASVAISGPSSITLGGLGSGTVTRSLPASYQPGLPFVVTNQLVPGPGTGLALVEEAPPSGWPVTAVSNDGTYDADRGLVKWGPFLDDVYRRLTYSVTPPDSAHGEVLFSGQGTFDEATVGTTGNLLLSRRLADSGSVTRSLPGCRIPGEVLSITNHVVPEPDVTAYAVVESLPDGWSVTDPGTGSWNTEMQRVSWGPFFDNQPRTLVFQVRSPDTDRATVVFAGTATFGDHTVNHRGQAALEACPVGRGSVHRSLPAYFIPGQPVTVTLLAVPDAGVSSFFVEEQPPGDWIVFSVTQYGTTDPSSGTIKWGPFLDDQPRYLSYQASPPASTGPSVAFDGTAYFDGQSTPVQGPVSLPRNQPPSLTPIPGQSTPEDTPLLIVFSVADAETPADQLAVQFSTDHPALFSSTLLGTSGANRSLTLVPATNTSGFASAQLVVSDGEHRTTNLFGVRVSSLNDPPWLQVPDRLTVWQGAPTLAITNVDGGDSDAAQGLLRLSLTNTAGSVTVLNLANASIRGGVNGSSDLLLEGDAASIHAALQSLHLAFPDTFAGEARLELILSDQGHAGTGGERTTGAFIPVTVISTATPVQAVADTVLRPSGRSLKIRVSQLLANDLEHTGRPLTVTAVDATSQHGARISLAGVWVTYSPPEGFNGTDAFHYTVGNGAGDQAVGTVTLEVQESPADPTANVLSLSHLPTSGFKQIRFQGVPGRIYRIQATDGLFPVEWITLGLVTSSPNGVYEFTDEDTTHGTRYYRAIWP